MKTEPQKIPRKRFLITPFSILNIAGNEYAGTRSLVTVLIERPREWPDFAPSRFV